MQHSGLVYVLFIAWFISQTYFSPTQLDGVVSKNPYDSKKGSNGHASDSPIQSGQPRMRIKTQMSSNDKTSVPKISRQHVVPIHNLIYRCTTRQQGGCLHHTWRGHPLGEESQVLKISHQRWVYGWPPSSVHLPIEMFLVQDVYQLSMYQPTGNVSPSPHLSVYFLVGLSTYPSVDLSGPYLALPHLSC